MRKIEAERSAALHRLVVERETLEAEEARARETAQRLRQRIAQTEQDIERDRALDQDACAALDVLTTEASGIENAVARSSDELRESAAAAAALNEALAESERNLERLTSELAEWHARKSSQERSRELATALAETSARQLTEAQARLDQAMRTASNAPDVRAAESVANSARSRAEAARAAAAAARVVLADGERAESYSRGPLEDAEREWQHLSAEAKALGDLLRPERLDLFPPLIDAVKVRPGYEAALAAALGDDLQAPLDEASPQHWRNLGPFDSSAPLPAGTKSLGEFVEAPAALARRLAMTGIVF